MSGAALDPPFADDAAESGRRQEDLVLLNTAAVRARRHPRAIVGLWAWETVLALLVGWPAAGLAHAAWSGDPHGDAPLWAPGGHALLDWLWHDAHALSSLSHSAMLALGIGAVAGLVPATALMITLAYATRDRRATGLARAAFAGRLRVFPAMLLLLLPLRDPAGARRGRGRRHRRCGGERDAQLPMGRPRAQVIEGLLVPAVRRRGIGPGRRARPSARGGRALSASRVHRAFGLGMRTLRLAPVTLWWSWGVAGACSRLAARSWPAGSSPESSGVGVGSLWSSSRYCTRPSSSRASRCGRRGSPERCAPWTPRSASHAEPARPSSAPRERAVELLVALARAVPPAVERRIARRTR